MLTIIQSMWLKFPFYYVIINRNITDSYSHLMLYLSFLTLKFHRMQMNVEFGANKINYKHSTTTKYQCNESGTDEIECEHGKRASREMCGHENTDLQSTQL